MAPGTAPRILYLESFAGIAGDMFSAAFLDAGLVDPDEIQRTPALLGFPDVTVEVSATRRAGARFTHIRVVPPPGPGNAGGDHHHHEPHHPYAELVERLESSSLPSPARAFALRVFRLLAEAEADAHGTSLEAVSFHEVGAVDSVVDVAMAGICIARLAPDRILASPVKLGRGSVKIQHGTYPVPPPASARLAMGMPVAPVPEAVTLPDVELSTPTGLAILKALEPTFVQGWPQGTLLAQGAGAGTRDLGPYPNVFRVAVLSGGDPSSPGTELSLFERDRVVEIRCNVDDQTGERTAWVMEKALALGALDAWVVPILGKKGRPAQCLVFLVSPGEVSRFADFLLRRTASYGIRYASWDRLKLSREEEIRETPRGPVRFSVGRTVDGERVKEKPEFEELKKIWEEDPDFSP